MPKNNFNTSNNIENDSQLNFDSLLLDIMSERFPDVQAYKEGRLLQEPEAPESAKPFEPKSTKKSNGRYQINLDKLDDGNIVFKNQQIGSVQPTVDEEALADLLDETFDFFVDEDLEVGEQDEIPEDKFIMMVDAKRNDLHNEFLQGRYPVIFLEKGEVKIYPNYKTLEVELTDKGLTYDDLEIATDDEIAKYNLYSLSDEEYRVGKMIQDRSEIWTLPTRFESGYLPIAPFKRDPGDYFDADLGYQPNVYKDQTQLEFLRAKYEGKGIIYDVPYARDERQRLDTSEIQGTGIDDLQANINVNNIRIMIKGFWKLPDTTDSRIYRLYKEFQNLDVVTSEDIRKTVERLVLAGAIESLEAFDGDNPTLNSQDIPMPVWNDFPHINSEVDKLDYDEYIAYWESTNQGNPFDIEYMEPYEPEGSIRYYSIGETAELALQAANSYQSLINEQQAYYGATGPMSTLLDLIESGITAAGTKINSFDGNYVTSTQYKSQWDAIYWDIFHAFVNKQNELTDSSNQDHKLKRGGIFGGTRRTRPSVFKTVNKYMKSRRAFNRALAQLDKQEDTGKSIGARGGTSVLTLSNAGIRLGYGDGQGPNDSFYNPGQKSPFRDTILFQESLSKGLYNIYSEFDRYIGAVSIAGVGAAVNELQNKRSSLINIRQLLYTFENGEYIVDLNKALYEDAYTDQVAVVNNILSDIEAVNTNISVGNVSNVSATVQSVFNAMKRACYLKAYRMIDCARRKISKDTNYYLRLSNRTVNVFQSAIPELNNTDLYFRNQSTSLPFFRSEVEQLYNTELDFITKAFITDAGMQFLNGPVPNLGNYGNFFPNPTIGS